MISARGPQQGITDSGHDVGVVGLRHDFPHALQGCVGLGEQNVVAPHGGQMRRDVDPSSPSGKRADAVEVDAPFPKALAHRKQSAVRQLGETLVIGRLAQIGKEESESR